MPKGCFYLIWGQFAAAKKGLPETKSIFGWWRKRNYLGTRIVFKLHDGYAVFSKSSALVYESAREVACSYS